MAKKNPDGNNIKRNNSNASISICYINILKTRSEITPNSNSIILTRNATSPPKLALFDLTNTIALPFKQFHYISLNYYYKSKRKDVKNQNLQAYKLI